MKTASVIIPSISHLRADCQAGKVSQGMRNLPLRPRLRASRDHLIWKNQGGEVKTQRMREAGQIWMDLRKAAASKCLQEGRGCRQGEWLCLQWDEKNP